MTAPATVPTLLACSRGFGTSLSHISILVCREMHERYVHRQAQTQTDRQTNKQTHTHCVRGNFTLVCDGVHRRRRSRFGVTQSGAGHTISVCSSVLMCSSGCVCVSNPNAISHWFYWSHHLSVFVCVLVVSRFDVFKQEILELEYHVLLSDVDILTLKVTHVYTHTYTHIHTHTN